MNDQIGQASKRAARLLLAHGPNESAAVYIWRSPEG